MTMNSKNKASLGYKLLFAYARFHFRLFYPHIHVEGIENIPKDKPLIFASNHQNALMDALAVLFTANRPIYFLARADIFKKKWLERILTFLKLMPVYRMRDGADMLQQNKSVFQTTAHLLLSGQALGVFPEGSHQDKKRLQYLKKGICRIAFEAAAEMQFTLNFDIVPIGLDYSNYQKQGADLIVSVGNPIEVMNYYSLYHDNPNRAITKLRDDLEAALKPLMIHCENLKEYDFIKNYAEYTIECKAINKGYRDPYCQFKCKQQLITELSALSIEQPSVYQELKDKNSRFLIGNYINTIPQPGRKPSTIAKVIIKVLLTFWFVVPGTILNFIPYKLIIYLSSKAKDPQFVSSFRMGFSLILYPVWYLFLLLMMGNSIGYLSTILIVIIAISTGILTLRYSLFKKI